ncbi:hypothetical protein POTOM_028943 [Populus tomentosa]|uniref:Nucleotidyl transferase domain-containing protein n=1 Tax=Populus tomentosa TaxID=118781 RepID=A0A8X7ZBA9_POPTO|nr:hypothetical protein POTOM_028943 [Populus tomentosa]
MNMHVALWGALTAKLSVKHVKNLTFSARKSTALMLSSPTPVNPQAKFSIPELAHSSRKHLTTLSSFSLPSLFISNSQQPQHLISSFSPVNQSVAAIVFGDGSESRLYPLTKRRSEGAIPLGAKYKIVDVVINNCINSNINKIYALTQYNSTYLNSHLLRAYSGLGLGKDGFVEVITAYQSLEDQGWFQADITIAALNSTRDQDPGFATLKVNSLNEVAGFHVKSEREPMIVPSAQSSQAFNDNAYRKLSSMGIYLVNRDIMTKLLNEYFPQANEFGTEVIPGAISIGMKVPITCVEQVQAYVFDGYWEDMSSIATFYQANA